MTFDLTDCASYKAYFAKLAKESKLLGESQYLFGDVEVGQSEASEWKGKKLWAWPSERARMQDQLSDNLYLTREGSIWIGGGAPEKFADRDTYYQECEAIVKKLLSKINFDRSESLLSTNFSSYTMQRADMMLGGSPFIGCELILNWDDPDGFEYDEDDWNLPEEE